MFRDGDVQAWIEHFAITSAEAAGLADAYLDAVTVLMERWRDMLRDGDAPRVDAAAWAVINVCRRIR